MGVWVGVFVGVGELVGVGVAVFVGDGVSVAVPVGVAVKVGVFVGVGVNVAVGEGVSVGVGVNEGIGVGVSVGVCVNVGVGDGVSVAVPVGVGVDEGVGVGGSGNATSTAPISQAGPWGRRMPRWSVGGQLALSAPSIAGEGPVKVCVSVGPPLSCSGPNTGLVLLRSPGAFRPHEVPLSRLCPPDNGGNPAQLLHWLLAIMLFVSVSTDCGSKT